MNLLNLESELSARIEYRVKSAIGTQFPDLNFSTEVSDIPAEFPNVFINEERLTETGNTLEGKTFNAVDFAMQLVIKTNTTKADVLTVRNACIDAIKADGFRIIINEPQKINNVYQCTLHFYGVRGAGDTFY